MVVPQRDGRFPLRIPPLGLLRFRCLRRASHAAYERCARRQRRAQRLGVRLRCPRVSAGAARRILAAPLGGTPVPQGHHGEEPHRGDRQGGRDRRPPVSERADRARPRHRSQSGGALPPSEPPTAASEVVVDPTPRRTDPLLPPVRAAGHRRYPMPGTDPRRPPADLGQAPTKSVAAHIKLPDRPCQRRARRGAPPRPPGPATRRPLARHRRRGARRRARRPRRHLGGDPDRRCAPHPRPANGRAHRRLVEGTPAPARRVHRTAMG